MQKVGFVNLAPSDFSQIPMSPNLATTLARASDISGSSGAAEVALEHVLLALCEDPDAEAVMMASRVDVARVRNDTIGFLATLPKEQVRDELGVSPALSRILEAAAAAARGGRRRDINGAIVLAAIVGDGKSAAAQILQAHGLTFDEAIRALQAALAAPSRDIVPDFRPADDVLARARERVQSRSAPTLRDMMRDAPRPALPPPPPAAPLPRMEQPESPSKIAPEPVAPQSDPTAKNAENKSAPDLESARPEPIAPAPSAPVDLAAEPKDRPAPSPAPAPALPAAARPNEPPFGFDLNRPAPVATPPPIPPPVPHQARPPFTPPPAVGYGAPSPFPPGSQPPPYAPAPMRMPQPHGPEGYAPMGPPPSPPPMSIPPSGPKRSAQAPKQNRPARAKVEPGQLAENIPRKMRVGRPERVEVRIAKASAKAITEGLEGGGIAWRHDVVVTQAMSVRLRAPEGGFFVETVSPETQWIENQLGFGDDFASWRFVVTPQSRGWSRLQIIISARTIGADGTAAETALPDQVVDVKVRTNYARAFVRLMGWTIAAVAGGALAKFGEGGLTIANGIIQKFMH